MRVCPKCKYVDLPYWKHVKWSYYIDSCSFENFKMMFPELADRLIEQGYADDEDYCYRIPKAHGKITFPMWVQRKAKIDFTIGWSDAIEMFNHQTKRYSHSYHQIPDDFKKDWLKIHPNQRRLLEMNK